MRARATPLAATLTHEPYAGRIGRGVDRHPVSGCAHSWAGICSHRSGRPVAAGTVRCTGRRLPGSVRARARPATPTYRIWVTLPTSTDRRSPTSSRTTRTSSPASPSRAPTERAASRRTPRPRPPADASPKVRTEHVPPNKRHSAWKAGNAHAAHRPSARHRDPRLPRPPRPRRHPGDRQRPARPRRSPRKRVRRRLHRSTRDEPVPSPDHHRRDGAGWAVRAPAAPDPAGGW
jgi:hypothetical protein